MQIKPRVSFLITHTPGRSLAIIVPFLLFFFQVAAQDRLKTPIKLKVEDGNFDEVSVVMKNNTTGESNTIPGVAKFDLDLKINCEYVISFSKPGYITKKIALNTNAPADRVSQGFYPFNFEVVLFKQYDGVNIVIFNQPVGKISYNRLVDDFDYDTDYTKQIQSALKAAEDEIKKKQQEAKSMDAQLKKEAEKKKAEEAAESKALAKANLEAEKKAAEEAKILAAQAAKDKKALDEQQKKDAKATAEAEKQRAMAQMEQEERAKAKAAEEEEERLKATATAGNENPPKNTPSAGGAENRPSGNLVSGVEGPVTASVSGGGEEGRADGKQGGDSESFSGAAVSGSSEESAGKKLSKGSGSDEKEKMKADPNKRSEKGVVKADANEGSDNRPEATPAAKAPSPAKLVPAPVYEVLPDISVEEINEANRTITKVTVRKNEKETVFSKVKYTWGGIYYFRQNMSISESLYFMNTGRR